MPLIAIEIKNRANQGYQFLPLQMKLRGTLDFAAPGDPDLYGMGQEFNAQPIPGQRLYLDVEKREAAIVEPLNSNECAPVAQKLARKLSSSVRGVGGLAFAKDQRFTNVDACTYLYHMRRAVEGGHAVVISGDINTKVPGVPQTQFLHKRQPDENASTIKALVETTNLLAALVMELIPADKRKAVADKLTAKKD